MLKWDRSKLILYLLIALFAAVFAIFQAGSFARGLVFILAVALAFALLVVLARLIIILVKKSILSAWPYEWRQGLANLHRPNNQTLMLMLSIGLGTFLIGTLYLTEQTLLRQVEMTGKGNRPNLILFDIQSDQKEAVTSFVSSQGLPIMQEVPVVTMRLETVRDRSVRSILNDSSSAIPTWTLTREYRTTYRDSLIASEKLIAGEWHGQVGEPNDSILVSIENGIAEDLQVSVGDRLVFDVQGIPLETRVGSIREVDWQRIQTNFFVVFPAGVLETAPQFHVIVTRTSSKEAAATVQRGMIERFPNVSAVDLQLIFTTIDKILDKIAFVIQFMALFSIFTGLAVLISAVMTSRFQRIQESVLLRTLGASRSQILKILTMEYVFLGGFAASAGLLLANGATWALSVFVFDSNYTPGLISAVVIFLLVVGMTVAVGLLNSRGIVNRPPLEVLRAEV